ncbi:helix-turn-helix domain-containing protein [Bacteroidota bacterium]
MKERLLELLKAEKFTPSAFADEIGVQRSSVSHILSGRNNPGYDFLQKTLIRFNRINADWLITGMGNMYSNIVSNELFNDISDNEEDNKLLIHEKSENIPEKVEERPKDVGNINIELEIEKIIIFYSDKSFKEFKPS